MAAEYEITVRIDADTREAKQALSRLGRKKQNAKRKSAIRSFSIRRAVGVVAALAPVVRMRRIGAQDFDMYAEALTDEMALADQAAASFTGYSKSRKDAREQAKAVASQLVGRIGYVPQTVRDMYEFDKEQNIREEKGLYALRQDPRFSGPGIGDVIAMSVEGYGKLIRSSFAYWKKELGL